MEETATAEPEEGHEQDAPKADKAKREASTIAFPYSDLGDATALARAIWDNVGTSTCDQAQLAAWAGHDTMESGTFRTRMSAARVFGVISTGSKQVALTDLGRAIVDPDRAAQARIEAFLAVPLYRRLFERYEGTTLPTTNVALERDLVDIGVAEKQKDRARQVFQRSAEQAGFFAQGRNRLVRPAVRQDEHREREQEQTTGGGGGGSGSGEIPAFVQVLVKALPPEGKTFPQAARQKWVKLALATFDVVYEDDPSSSGLPNGTAPLS